MAILLVLTLPVFSIEVFKNFAPGRLYLFDDQENLYVDTSLHSISIFSQDGKSIRQIGRDGEGPGDIKRLGWFALNPIDGAIYVTEFINGNRWISRFSKDGKYIGHWDCDIDWSKYVGLSMIQFDSFGNAFIQTYKFNNRREKTFTLGTVENKILKLSPKGKLLKTVYSFATDFSADQGGKGNITIPFHNYLFWSLYNDMIFIRESNADVIAVYDNDGNFKNNIPLPFKREKVADKDLEEWETWLKTLPNIKRGIAEGWFDLKFWRKNLNFPEYKPVSGERLFFDSKGNLFSKQYSGYETISNRWAQINLNDNSVRVVNFFPNEQLVVIWKDCFYFGKHDDENFFLIKRKKDEIEYLGADNEPKK